MLTIPVPVLANLYNDFARGFGASTDEAKIFQRCFVNADLRGKDTQGIALLPLSYNLLRAGAARFGAEVTITSEKPSTLVIDGGRGVGQIVATRAMSAVIERAASTGLSAGWIRNTNDFGMASNYAMMALEDDFAGMAMSNGVPLVAAWGGSDPLFSTNPMSLAIPADHEIPIVIDTSSSPMSHGKVVLAARDRQRVPLGTLVNTRGEITDDPTELVVDVLDRDFDQIGAIMPAGPKGFSWTLFVELLTGLMSGMTASKDVSKTPDAEHPSTMGQFVMAVNIGALTDVKVFKRKVDGLIRAVKRSRPVQEGEPVRLPGEYAALEAKRRRAEGVPVRNEEWEIAVRLARELGVSIDDTRNES